MIKLRRERNRWNEIKQIFNLNMVSEIWENKKQKKLTVTSQERERYLTSIIWKKLKKNRQMQKIDNWQIELTFAAVSIAAAVFRKMCKS